MASKSSSTSRQWSLLDQRSDPIRTVITAPRGADDEPGTVAGLAETDGALLGSDCGAIFWTVAKLVVALERHSRENSESKAQERNSAARV